MILQSVVPTITSRWKRVSFYDSFFHFFFLTLNCHIYPFSKLRSKKCIIKIYFLIATNLPHELSAHVYTCRQSEKFPAVKDLKAAFVLNVFFFFFFHSYKDGKKENSLRHALFKTNFTSPIIYILYFQITCEISHSSRHNNKRETIFCKLRTFFHCWSINFKFKNAHEFFPNFK